MSSGDTAVCSMDCRCKNGRFPASASGVAIPSRDSLSRSDTGVDPGI